MDCAFFLRLGLTIEDAQQSLGFTCLKRKQEEARTTKEDMEDASGEGEEGRRFGEKGRHQSSKVENWS